MKRYVKLFAFLLVFTMIFGETCMASAATKSVTMNVAKKDIETIKKTGTYKLINKKKSFGGIVKFVAPKTRSYVFTFYGLSYKGESKDIANTDSSYWTKKAIDSPKYDHLLNISMQVKDSKGDLSMVEFSDESMSKMLINNHLLLNILCKNGDYKSLKDAAKGVKNLSKKDLDKLLDGKVTKATVTLDLKKGEEVYIEGIGGYLEDYCKLKIKAE